MQQANGASKSSIGGAEQFANEPSSGYELETRGSVVINIQAYPSVLPSGHMPSDSYFIFTDDVVY